MAQSSELNSRCSSRGRNLIKILSTLHAADLSGHVSGIQTAHMECTHNPSPPEWARGAAIIIKLYYFAPRQPAVVDPALMKNALENPAQL